VCFGRRIIFVAHPQHTPDWKLLVPGSDHWDMVHQRIYRNGGADPIGREDIPSTLPPAPTHVLAEVVARLNERARPEPPAPTYPAAEFPQVASYMSAIRLCMLDVHFLLYEDRYESALGDGKFHYPEAAFLERTEMDAYIAQCRAKDAAIPTSVGYDHHPREVKVRLTNGLLDCPGLKRQMFDHFDGRDVLVALERLLSGV
jgi:hypothetical protein